MTFTRISAKAHQKSSYLSRYPLISVPVEGRVKTVSPSVAEFNDAMILKSIKEKAYAKKLRGSNVPEVFRHTFTATRNMDMKQSLKGASFVVIDAETTGLQPEKGDELLSIAGLRYTQGRLDLSNSFYELIKPKGKVPPRSVIIHHITPNQLKHLPDVSVVLERFFEFCGGDILVGHHAIFDARFISFTLRKLFGITLANRVIDTAVLARAIDEMEDPVRFSMGADKHIGLDELAKKFDISMPDRHDAYGDAFATALIFQRQIGILEENGITRVKELIGLGGVR